MRLFVAVATCCWVTLAAAQPADVARSTAPASGSTISVTAPDKTEVLSAESSGTSAPAASVPLDEPLDATKYICGPGDVFELNFWGQQNFRLRIAVDLEARMFITKVGFVSVAGKTLASVREQVTKKVRGQYPGLQFELSLLTPRNFLVHLAENVKRPGSYSAAPTDRVSAVLGRSGGSTGSVRRIEIKRKAGGHVVADLTMYELTGDTKYNPLVLDGDVIRVPFPELSATVSGAVKRPGTYELVDTKDLAELLALAGGYASNVAPSLPARLTRRNGKLLDALTELSFSNGQIPNMPLVDGDRIAIRASSDLQPSVLLMGAVAGADNVDAATTLKRLPFVEGDTVLTLLERSGGIQSSGDLKRAYISRPRSAGGAEIIAVDLDALIVRRDFRANKRIQLGDTLVVPAVQLSVVVEGAVAHAGMYPFNPLFGVREYIARAGGTTRAARNLDSIKLTDQNGQTHAYTANLKLKPGDTIVVPERSWTRSELVQLTFASAGLLLSVVALTLTVTR
jgi:polysaccharide biosynthesis/export protein